MSETDWLAESFEAQRPRLRGVAYRMLGSLAEAEDAVQEAWLRLARAGADGIENLGGWLTTVVARVCLDMLRSRKTRGEEPLEARPAEPAVVRPDAADPEREAVLADSVGLAMLVVLEMLPPSERVAFVLHDMFAMPFDEIAPIVGRSTDAARQLASRARRRVQGADVAADADLSGQRKVIDAFLSAARGGDLGALIALLDPNVVLRYDRGIPPEMATEVRGAAAVAARVVQGGARAARPALVDGSIGVVVAPRGRLLMVLRYTIRDGRIATVDAVSDPARVRALDIKVLEA